jgi:hypothetical protein
MLAGNPEARRVPIEVRYFLEARRKPWSVPRLRGRGEQGTL